jgi:hypothetical protein
MIAITLSDELIKRLDEATKKTDKNRSFLIRESLERFLDELLYEYEKREIKIDLDIPFYELLIKTCQEPMKMTTGARNVVFTMFSDQGKLYVLNSRGKTRPLDEKPANAFFEMYKKTGSTSPITYRDLTFNSSYYLAAIHELIRREVI